MRKLVLVRIGTKIVSNFAISRWLVIPVMYMFSYRGKEPAMLKNELDVTLSGRKITKPK